MRLEAGRDSGSRADRPPPSATLVCSCPVLSPHPGPFRTSRGSPAPLCPPMVRLAMPQGSEPQPPTLGHCRSAQHPPRLLTSRHGPRFAHTAPVVPWCWERSLQGSQSPFLIGAAAHLEGVCPSSCPGMVLFCLAVGTGSREPATPIDCPSAVPGSRQQRSGRQHPAVPGRAGPDSCFQEALWGASLLACGGGQSALLLHSCGPALTAALPLRPLSHQDPGAGQRPL